MYRITNKMAANEEPSSLWRTPRSTPAKSNENGFQDSFRHSEKLLASAVSICRLKGSVECQTGGLITVCEEMLRLVRLAFSENAKLEKELKKQKLAFDDEVSLLKERVAYLEDENELSKHSVGGPRSTTQCPEKPIESLQTEQGSSKDKHISPANSEPDELIIVDCNDQEAQEVEQIQDKDVEVKYLEESEGLDCSLEVSYLESKHKGDIRKRLLGKVGNAVKSRTSSQKIRVNELVDDNKTAKKRQSKDNVDTEQQVLKPRKSFSKGEDTDTTEGDISKEIHLNPQSGLLETTKSEDELDMATDNATNKKGSKVKRKKGRADVKKKDSSRVDVGAGIRSEITESSTEMNDFDFEKSILKSSTGSIGKHPHTPVVERCSNQGTIEKKQNKASASKVESPDVSREEEKLGDVSFLIDVSSMISSFMSQPDTTELELPLMAARERADARKLASLFNLHTSISKKMENRSSLLLSKTANSKMPKPGKLDNLLSQLSIAATKEAERVKSKARGKRKLSATNDSNKANADGSQSMKNNKGLSEAKKVRL